jgi:hypothetical protein
MTVNIKDFYLTTPMERPEFMRLKLSDIPGNIIDLYKLRDIAHDGYVYVCIQKGMYGLPQAGIIAQNSWNNDSRPRGITKAKSTLGSGSTTGDISFALCVNDFGVKYVGKAHADHLLQTLKEHYEISSD